MSERLDKDPFPVTIEEQIEYFHRVASRRPGPNDPMNMVGFGATLLLGKLTVLQMGASW